MPARLACLVILLGLVSSQALAGNTRTFAEERFVINVGALFAQDIETKLQVRGSDDIGDFFTLENDLGFDDSETAPFIDGYFRFGSSRKHRLWFGYGAINRDSMTVLEEDIEIDDEIFPIGAEVAVNFDSSAIEIAYAYSFVLSEKTEFAVILGLHWMDYSFGIRVTQLPPAKGMFDRIETANVEGPFPNLGAQLRYAFTPSFWGHGSFKWLDIEIGDYDGSLTDATLGVTYQFNNTFGLDLSWGFFQMDVGVTSGDWRGSLDYNFSGPVLTGQFRF